MFVLILSAMFGAPPKKLVVEMVIMGTNRLYVWSAYQIQSVECNRKWAVWPVKIHPGGKFAVLNVRDKSRRGVFTVHVGRYFVSKFSFVIHRDVRGRILRVEAER